MTITEALKTTFGGRVSCGYRQMIWDNQTSEWVVYTTWMKHGVRNPIIIRTMSEQDAVDKLVGED